MPSRILREGIIESRAVNALTIEGEVLYRRLMSVVDDYGRMEADIDILRARLFPLQLDRWSRTMVSDALADVSGVRTDDGHPLVTVYVVELSGKKYLQINKFCQRVRSEKSKCPSPDGQMTVTRVTMSASRDARGCVSRACSESEASIEGEGEGEGDAREQRPSDTVKSPPPEPTPTPPARPPCEFETGRIAAALAEGGVKCRDDDPEKLAQAAVSAGANERELSEFLAEKLTEGRIRNGAGLLRVARDDLPGWLSQERGSAAAEREKNAALYGCADCMGTGFTGEFDANDKKILCHCEKGVARGRRKNGTGAA